MINNVYVLSSYTMHSSLVNRRKRTVNSVPLILSLMKLRVLVIQTHQRVLHPIN